MRITELIYCLLSILEEYEKDDLNVVELALINDKLNIGVEEIPTNKNKRTYDNSLN